MLRPVLGILGWLLAGLVSSASVLAAEQSRKSILVLSEAAVGGVIPGAASQLIMIGLDTDPGRRSSEDNVIISAQLVVDEAGPRQGNEARFRPLSVWEHYRWQLILVALAILLQAVLIAGLLHEHRRRSRAEEESLRRINELARLNRIATAGELSATIAHELKQPLTAIISNGGAGLRWLGRQAPDVEQAQEILKRIINEGDRANRIIDEIRAMFRKDNNVRGPVDVRELIRETIPLVEVEMQKHDVLLETALVDAPKPVTLADRVQLQQVILNLIMNAIEAMAVVTKRTRLLRISLSVDDKRSVLITIQDSGPGIEPDNIDKIFDSFFTTKSNGMGLGLSICRSIIEAHGGRLWAEHGAPNGAVFNIFLPGNRKGF